MIYRFIWCFLWEDKNLELSLWCLISVLPSGDESGGKLYKIMCCLEGQLWRGQRDLLTCTFFQFIIILMPKLNILQWHILLPFIIYVVTGCHSKYLTYSNSFSTQGRPLWTHNNLLLISSEPHFLTTLSARKSVTISGVV